MSLQPSLETAAFELRPSESSLGLTSRMAAAKHEDATGRLVVLQALGGSMARATAAVLLIPLDTCKTRLQFQGIMSDTVVRRYTGLWDAFRTILREEGVLAFYRGKQPQHQPHQR